MYTQINLQIANEKCLAIYDSATGDIDQSCDQTLTQPDYIQAPVSEELADYPDDSADIDSTLNA